MRKFDSLGRSWVLGGALLLGASWTGTARAADEAAPAPGAESERGLAVTKLNEDGAALYQARDYRRAVEKFLEAYAKDQDPNLLFNIARCYEALGDDDAAAEKYETFLSAPGADADGKQRATQALTALHNRQQHVQPTPDAAPRASVGPPEAGQVAPTRPSESPGNSFGVLPWLFLTGGAAATAAGVTFYVLGSQDHAEVTDAPGYDDPNAVDAMTRAEAQELVRSGDRKKLFGGIALGVGGALFATSVVLFVMDGPGEEKAGAGVAFRLDLAPDTGSLRIDGRF